MRFSFSILYLGAGLESCSSSTGSSVLPGAQRFTNPLPTRAATRVKAPNNPLFNNDDNNNNDSSKPYEAKDFYEGPNRFSDDQSNYSKERLKGSELEFQERRTQKNFDRHPLPGIEGNKNKENLELYKEKTRDMVDNPEFKGINVSSRHQEPAYIFLNDKTQTVVIINSKTNDYISTFNATQKQLDQLKETKNIGLYT